MVPYRATVRTVVCGTDNSFLLSRAGGVLACGCNDENKSCLDQILGPRRRSSLTLDRDHSVMNQLTFTPIKKLKRFHIHRLAAGHTHGAAVDEYGRVFTFGSNTYGQLGHGDYKKRSGVQQVMGVLLGKQVHDVACGNGFTMVTTADQHVYSWGRGDLGQLCSSDHLQSPSNKMCIALPRPVFSALHVVTALCCRHWHGILVAEKVLSKRTIISTSKDHPARSLSEPGGGSSGLESTPDSHELLTGSQGDDTPVWLKMELAEERLTMPATGVLTDGSSKTLPGSEVCSNSQRSTFSSGGTGSTDSFMDSPPKKLHSVHSTGRSTPPLDSRSQLSPITAQQRFLHLRQLSGPASPGGQRPAANQAGFPIARSSSSASVLKHSTRPTTKTPPPFDMTDGVRQLVEMLRHERNDLQDQVDELQSYQKMTNQELKEQASMIQILRRENEILRKNRFDLYNLFQDWRQDCDQAVLVAPEGVRTGPPPLNTMSISEEIEERR